MEKILTNDDLNIENKIIQDNLLLDTITEACTDPESNISPQLRAKVTKILDDCDLTQYTSLHKLNTANESSSTVLGLIHKSEPDLTYDERFELNEAIIEKIRVKMTRFLADLGRLKDAVGSSKKTRMYEVKDMEERLAKKFETLNAQEEEKIQLMLEWLNYRLQEVATFSSNSNDLLSLKTRILELKSHILHLQILRNVFTETNQTIKAYNELHKDMTENMEETQQRIQKFNKIINEDYN